MVSANNFLLSVSNIVRNTIILYLLLAVVIGVKVVETASVYILQISFEQDALYFRGTVYIFFNKFLWHHYFFSEP